MENKLIRWARPALLWLGMVAMVLTDILLPSVSHFLGLGLPKLTVDKNFWDAWTFAVSIYIGGRTIEKIGGLPGKKKEPKETPSKD